VGWRERREPRSGGGGKNPASSTTALSTQKVSEDFGVLHKFKMSNAIAQVN
jgi:hypothetical protein